jgi:hypothetical protein
MKEDWPFEILYFNLDERIGCGFGGVVGGDTWTEARFGSANTIFEGNGPFQFEGFCTVGSAFGAGE